MADFNVTDTDAHFHEPAEGLAAYVDDDNPWAKRLFDGDGGIRNLPNSTGDRFVEGRITREAMDFPGGEGDPADIPGVMAHLGLDAIVLLSHVMLTFGRIRGDDERMTILSNAYADYMLDRVVDPSEGIYTLVPVPYTDPAESADLIDRVGDERGVAGIVLVTAGPEPPLGNRRYDPIYEAAVSQDLPIVFHGGGAGLNEYHTKGYEKFIETHVLGFLENNISQCVSLVVQGVPVRYPELTIAFQESGIYWVPLVMQRLDAEYMKRASEVPILEKRPSEYMLEFFYGTQPMEDPRDPEHLRQVVDQLGGADRLMYASDYPHWDYDPPEVIAEKAVFTDAEKRRILAGTAREVFGI